ncbi:FRG domain-containing protein [Rhizobium lentis]|uniref:FRG domain-containing protein n=1 Tax=Rhizobium lentis TaxID=1138194 RepID=UPI001C832070|nr:FRG domain-containing protein [Rhizobium lentis]MBX5070496.1 FRG domain-containing protein [Rhizobium lentis]MBX5104251.1 FRG domain-containing protein [Rhizobium lentis]
METVGTSKLWSFDERGSKVSNMTCTAVRHSSGHRVNSYLDLAKKVAELQFMNRDLVLVFRGQSADYKNKSGNTSLKPTILRASNAERVPTDAALAKRYAKLAEAEAALIQSYRSGSTPGSTLLRRQRILRWSILQHYEVCGTPLLDVSQSLRIAASFASLASSETAYLMVLGVPNISGAITASADAGLQIIRLSSVCPPSAMRPHIQEGYLLGEYPEMLSVDQKQHYKHYEIDFGRRLVAKFVFDPKKFWDASADFPAIGKSALYPDQDSLLTVVGKVSAAIGSGVP